MADVSKIKLPSGTTYNIKDTVSGYTTNTGTITKVQTTAGAHTTINVSSGAAAFNVPTKTSHLTNDSGFLTSHQTLYEENIQWGPTSVSKAGSISPIGMSLSSEHSANRLAFIDGDALTFEYSSNGGSTYTNYNYDKATKSAFCTTSYGVLIGRVSGNYTTSSRTRITLTAQNGTTGYVYTNPKKLLINISSSGGMDVLIEYRTGTNYQNNGSWVTFGTYALSGWSGWNDIPLILGTLGGGTNQTSNNWQLRLTFIMTSVNSSYPTTAQVNSIRLFGENGWTVTSNMGTTGHLYSYDISQNATFPAKITANGGFSGNLTGNVTGNVSGSAGSVAWTGVTGKPSSTGSSTTGISIAAHGTGTVIGVQSTTTTASKVTVGSHSTDYGVKSAGSASTWTFEEKTIPNVTSAGTASSWTFEEKTIPNVTAAGSGSASLTFTMDTTDTKKLKITFSHTHTAPTIGTAIKVQSKSGGSNGTAPTLGTAIKVQSKSGGANSTAPTLGSKVPTVSASDVTVPIKNTSASTFVTGTTHTVTDNGHTHTI